MVVVETRAEVLKHFGNSNVATTSWAEGAWSNYRGWPSAVAFYEGRLWWAGKDKIYASVSDAFSSFDDTIEATVVVPSLTTVRLPDKTDQIQAPFYRMEADAVPMKLVLRGTASQLSAAHEYLRQIDVAPRQVALEMRVMELLTLAGW